MKFVKLALVLALFSASLGTINALMDVSGEDWFVEHIDPNMPSNDWENVTAGMEKESTGIIDDIFGILYKGHLLLSIFWEMLKGALFIAPTIYQVFYYSVNGTNVAVIIAAVIQITIWLIYAVGFYQLWHGDSIKHYW